MEGGINAWNGLVATGAPDAGMAYFSDKDKPEEIIALAWALEEGARRYYSGIGELVKDQRSKDLFKSLVADEVRHKSMLIRLHKELSGDVDGSELPGALTSEELSEVMEGGMRINEALNWAEGKGIKEILDFSIAMEINSYDLYMKMERSIEGEDTKKIFTALADEEKKHLDQLASLLNEEVQ
ncbi:MAG: ferritin family protein [Nitrospira sp.]|nr:ferritin family protein [Nitrospira sp.]